MCARGRRRIADRRAHAARARRGRDAAQLARAAQPRVRRCAKRRAHAIGWWTAAGSLSIAAGPVCGGLLLVGTAIDAAGFTLLLHAGADTAYADLWLPFPLIPAGMGLAVPAMTHTVLSGVDRHHAGTASAVLNTARQAAGAMGVAVYGALADGDAARIVHGMHAAALMSCALLVAAFALAWTVRTPRESALAHAA